MDIFRHQWKRILAAPFFLCLIAVFLAFDLYLISTLSGARHDINLINDVAGRTGVRIDAEFEKKFALILGAHTKDLEELYRLNTGETSADPSVMLQSLARNYDMLTPEQQERLLDDNTIVLLDKAIKNRGAFYEEYDVNAAGQTYIQRGKITGAPARFISQNCARLQERVVQIKSNGERDTLFFPGTVYQVHGFLYGTLLKAIVMESAILGVLVMFFTVNYEFAHGTQNLAYASRRGRKLLGDQFRAGMLAGMLVPVFFMGAALPVFFANYHFSNVWNSFVSSGMNAEPNGMKIIPYVTFGPMTMWQYLWANIGLVLVLQAVFCLLAFAAAVFCRNSYIGFLGYALAGMLLISIPSVLPWNTMLPLILSANSVVAWYDCGGWLTQVAMIDAYPGYFPVIFLLGASVTAIAAFFGIRRFRRADL